jgi:hypothetical protein
MKLTKVIKKDRDGNEHHMWAGPDQLEVLRKDPRITITKETADFDPAEFDRARAEAAKPKPTSQRKESPRQQSQSAEPEPARAEAAQPAG